MSKILKKVLLLIFVSMAIFAISASADSYKDKYNGKDSSDGNYPSEKCRQYDTCDKCNYNNEDQYLGKCSVTCCDYENCMKCGEKHYADGYCDKCGEKCSLYKYCPGCKEYYSYDGNHYCPKCNDFCYYTEHCDKCGYTHYYDGYCDDCGMKCYLGQCCYLKCIDNCKEPCGNCKEAPMKEYKPNEYENNNYNIGTTGYPTMTPGYNAPQETSQSGQTAY